LRRLEALFYPKSSSTNKPSSQHMKNHRSLFNHFG
jgi:hypothetical protein